MAGYSNSAAMRLCFLRLQGAHASVGLLTRSVPTTALPHDVFHLQGDIGPTAVGTAVPPLLQEALPYFVAQERPWPIGYPAVRDFRASACRT